MFCRQGMSSASAFWSSLLCLIVVVAVVAMSGCGQNRLLSTVQAATSTGATASTGPSTVGSSSSSTTSSSGSTTSTTGTSGTGSGGTTSAPAASGFDAVTNFGDSITCGYYATPNNGMGYMYSTNGYATLLDTATSAASKDLCRGGDMAADMAKLWVYPNAEPVVGANQLYTVLIGTNDAHFCGASGGCLANWSQSLAASLAWLALPEADKVLGSAMTAVSGAWAPDMQFGEATTGGGGVLSFNVQQAMAGRMLYVAYRVFDATERAGGSAVVSVDGVPAMTLSAASVQPIATQNGTTDTVFLASVPLGAAGQHSVTITTTSAEGATFSVLWAGASSRNYAAVSGAPTVVVGQVTPTGNAELNTIVGEYNAALAPLVAGLVSDGMHIVVAPTANAFNPVTDMSDLLHPNNVGHAKLAAVFASALPQ